MLVQRGNGPSNHLWTPDATFRAALDAISSPAAVIDATGHLAYCNPAWLALGARTPVYGDLGTLVSSSDREGSSYVARMSTLEGPLAMAGRRLARSIQSAVAGRETEPNIPYRMHRPEGESPCEASVAALPVGEKRLALVQHAELTDRERADGASALAMRLGLELESQRSRGRRLARQMAAIGNDLHTPITPVRLELHLLETGAYGPLTAEQARALAIISRNIQRWAEGESRFQRLGSLEPGTPAAVDLSGLVREAHGGWRSLGLQQGLQVVYTAPPGALPVTAVAEDVRDALDIVIEHALAASPAGSTIAIEAATRGPEAILEVRDSGPGLSPRDAANLFVPWEGRPPREVARGLAMGHVRQLIEGSGGRVWAHSDGPGQGLVLGFALPLLGPGGFEPAAPAS